MKDQYVGDINDFLKYALLRAWAARGLSVAVGWMRTAPDGRNDGGLLAYLESPAEYRALDPELYDLLRRVVEDGHRSVRAVMASGVVPAAVSYESLVDDDIDGRACWFDEFRSLA